MYQTLAQAYKKPSPLAEIHTEPAVESEEYYFSLLSDYGIKLNKPQTEAVKAVDGPVLVLAGAGSGKTTVLTTRIGYMIYERDIDPSNILLTTFTKKAATDMIERLARIPGMNRSASRSVTAGTYHSICLRILREEGLQFSVLSSERRKHIMLKSILRKMDLHEAYSPEAVAAIISSWKNAQLRPDDIMGDSKIELELKSVYHSYEEMLEQSNLYDFDDLLIQCYYLLAFNPSILKKYQDRYKYILCDEFQDSSKVQYSIIQLLADSHKNLCVVGDDSQTIYSYRGARASFMINFDKVYPNCQKVVMDINYRSGPSIVGLANSIIKYNKNQIKKTLKVKKSENHQVSIMYPNNSDAEAELIVQDIIEKRNRGHELKDMAVLYRTHSTGRAIFDKLVMSDIPFITYGKGTETFYQNQFIRPMIALLRVATNQRDIDAIVESAPIFYIKRTEMKDMIDDLIRKRQNDIPKNLLYRVLLEYSEKLIGFRKESLLLKIRCLKKIGEMTAPRAIQEIRTGEINYEKQLELDKRKTITVHKELLIEILDEFEQSARGFSNVQSFLSFIDQVEEKNNEMDELRNQPDIEAVRLMTIHASKGLEFKIAYALSFIEGVIPHVASMDTEEKEDSQQSSLEAIEEERRLAYVLTTRAKDHLYISVPKHHRDKKTTISRFLSEALEL
ncbi:ATP-dependent helicase [Bacillus cihuensis]|uniref:ATP-dependent helicase n=1 Tax=Bacillus cihuensis TaxID=1208599 RepID=UPI000411EA54|nr:ATP-dependent helicase [Bacillus cihuensis]